MSAPAGRSRLIGRLAALPAVVAALHLAGVLAPAEPRLLGAPLGLALQLGVVAASTAVLWLIARRLLPEREGEPGAGEQAGEEDRPGEVPPR